MGKTQTRHQAFEIGDVIRHRRRRHVRRKIISFEQGLPWTFRLSARGRFLSGNSMLITRIEEWEVDYGETQEDGETTTRQDNNLACLD